MYKINKNTTRSLHSSTTRVTVKAHDGKTERGSSHFRIERYKAFQLWEYDRTNCFLSRIHVDPHFRKQGIGSELFLKTLFLAKKARCSELYWYAQPLETDNISQKEREAFYTKHGSQIRYRFGPEKTEIFHDLQNLPEDQKTAHQIIGNYLFFCCNN